MPTGAGVQPRADGEPNTVFVVSPSDPISARMRIQAESARAAGLRHREVLPPTRIVPTRFNVPGFGSTTNETLPDTPLNEGVAVIQLA